MARTFERVTGRVLNDSNLWPFNCYGGALEKCNRYGRTPWETKNETRGTETRARSIAEYHQACTRMVRADYCGDGQTHTQGEGTLIDIYDNLGFNTRGTLGAWLVHGGRVVHRRRVVHPPHALDANLLVDCGRQQQRREEPRLGVHPVALPRADRRQPLAGPHPEAVRQREEPAGSGYTMPDQTKRSLLISRSPLYKH